MKIFISGGCKNGKSYYAQHLAKLQCTDTLYYIATMKPVDKEDDERIARHRQDREGWGFITIEQPTDIEHILDKCRYNASFLLDSLTALLANEMFLPNAGFDKHIYEHAGEKISHGLRRITDTIENIVIVSDYIYGDGHIYGRYSDPLQLTEKYSKSLAQIDRTAAENSDIVLEIAYTNVIVHKGHDVFGELCEKIP
jgi:adenosylcobinamide kinase/adenosylcobinamide-phosphate guanylyltransferase